MSNSYAEQFFGVKQNQILQYAENLAFFGVESYVYKNASLMKEVIENEIALLNPTTAYYAYLWAREKGYKAIDKFNAGLVIALYNSDLNMTYHFVLVDFNEDGSGVFINREPVAMLSATSATNYLEVLNYEDYELIQYLNGEKNWYKKWETKPSSNTEVITQVINGYKTLRYIDGFLNGFDYRLKKLLKTFKDGFNFPILPITHADYNNQTFANLGYKTNLRTINENCVDFYTTYVNTSGDVGNIKLGAKYYGCLIEEATADQITNRPSFRAGFDGNGGSWNVAGVQSSSAGVCSLTSNSPINVKIQF
jgi:hypothetical protein